LVLALAALAAAAASFPTGFGFGAGYGAGVRVGYDIIYPKIAPALRDIAEDIVGAVNKLFGGDAPTSSVPSGFDFAAGDTERTGRAEARFGSQVDIADVAVGDTPTAPRRKAAVIGEAAQADVRKDVKFHIFMLGSFKSKWIATDMSRSELVNLLDAYRKNLNTLTSGTLNHSKVRGSIASIVSALNRF